MTKTIERTLEERLIAALNEHNQAKQARPSENPLASHDLKTLTHGAGLTKSSDNIPARNMAVSGEPLGYDMEVARNAGITEGREDRSQKRKAAARARAQRKVDFDKIADSPKEVSPVRMTQAWYVVFPLVPEITRIANSKKRWAQRFLGTSTDDIGQMALEKMALTLAKSDKDLDLLRTAADQLSGEQKIKGFVGDQEVTKEERKEHKELKRARKWLMGMVHNRVMGALVDTYTSENNLRWDNIDLIATVMANINNPGDDPMTARFKADRAPAFMGTRFQRPGGIEPAALALGIAGAITERGLDALTEILLDEENRRTDGRVKWSAIAEQVFLASPGEGQWMWDVVVKATANAARPHKAQGDAARQHARLLFAFLPSVIMGLVDAFDQQAIGFAVPAPGGARAILASEFELFYLPEPSERRQPLTPTLNFRSSSEAAQVLVETLGSLVTGEDLVRSVIHA